MLAIIPIGEYNSFLRRISSLYCINLVSNSGLHRISSSTKVYKLLPRPTSKHKRFKDLCFQRSFCLLCFLNGKWLRPLRCSTTRRTEKGEKLPHRFVEKPAMRKLLPNLANKKVLMLGCGTGEESLLLEELGATAMALDILVYCIYNRLYENCYC